MPYHPDHELCLVIFDQQEEVPSYKKEGFWDELFKSGDKLVSWENHREVKKRNQIRVREAKSAIEQAKGEKYEPVYSIFQKGEYTILAIKGGKGAWRRFAAEKVAKGPYTDKIRAAVSNVIGKKNNPKEVKSWRQVLKLVTEAKSSNQQRNRQGNRQGNRKGNRNNYNNRRNQEGDSSQEQKEQMQKEQEMS
ncbi:MAG: hypothetical protein AAFR87_23335 [Bacteroidota bacterium]